MYIGLRPSLPSLQPWCRGAVAPWCQFYGRYQQQLEATNEAAGDFLAQFGKVREQLYSATT